MRLGERLARLEQWTEITNEKITDMHHDMKRVVAHVEKQTLLNRIFVSATHIAAGFAGVFLGRN